MDRNVECPEQQVCAQCGSDSLMKGSKVFDEIDELVWHRCKVCGEGSAHVTLRDIPEGALMTVLGKTSLKPEERGRLISQISCIYDRDVEWRAPEEIDIPWDYVKAAELLVRDSVPVPPNPTDPADKIGSQYKINRFYFSTSLYERLSSDPNRDDVANYDAVSNFRVLWPWRILDAMGLIHDGPEIWRLRRGDEPA